MRQAWSGCDAVLLDLSWACSFAATSLLPCILPWRTDLVENRQMYRQRFGVILPGQNGMQLVLQFLELKR